MRERVWGVAAEETAQQKTDGGNSEKGGVFPQKDRETVPQIDKIN